MNKLIFSSDKWFATIKQNPKAEIKMFCFPYGGGNASVFTGWPKFLPDFVELYAIQLPGRANRISESPIVNMNDLLTKLSLLLVRYIDRPYVFFGHSLGALIAFEISKRMEKVFGYQPEWLFLSAHSPPGLERKIKLYELSDDDFISEIRKKNGTPKEIFDNEELLSYVLPVLKSDYKLSETYSYNDLTKVNIPLHVFGGDYDLTVTEKILMLWKDFSTSNEFSFKSFPGDHFFLNKNQFESKLLEEVSNKLYEWKTSREINYE